MAKIFSLRIHTVDSSPTAEGPSGGGSSDASLTRHPPSETEAEAEAEAEAEELQVAGSSQRNPNPRIQAIRGVAHLYRNASLPSSSSSATRGTLLFIVAVPNSLSTEDFLRFCGSDADRSSEIRIIRNDGMEDRYSVLVKFDDQKSADAFYINLNGWRFPSAEGEVCHILFLVSVGYTESMEVADNPPTGYSELPTCPVCLERLDQDISGIIATTCDHSFHCSCISNWVNSSCTVCRFSREQTEKPTCSICGTLENLWICVICGFVGCGRYKEGHAIRHWQNSQHCYSLDLETQRVWDYVGDSYVHRLNQSKSDEKLAKLKSDGSLIGDNCENCEFSDDTGMSGAIFNSKLEAKLDEYNCLLASQLENQRQYYETLILEAKENREKYISEAVEKAVSIKLQEIQANIQNVIKEKKVISDINDNLMKNQNLWRGKIEVIEERERATLKLKDAKIHDLEEEIRDFTFFIEAQKKLETKGDADDVRGGTLMPVPPPPPATSTTRRASKANRRRR